MTKQEKGYEIIEHTADWALHIFAPDWQTLLLQAAEGMNSLMVTGMVDITAEKSQQWQFEAYDAETLLVDWLTELAYWAETASLIFTQFEIQQLSETRLEVTVRGGEVAELEKHIKAVTYHDLEIKETATGLEVTVVFDV